MSRHRIPEIDLALGIAMILVVLGHLSDYEPSWYENIKGTLYKFHMPFFMCLSGFLLSYTHKNFDTKKKYFHFIKTKVLKFIIPYIFMSFLFLSAKVVLKEYQSTDEILEMTKRIFNSPANGPSIFLWYIYVLFQYYLIFPILYSFKWIQNNFYLLILIGLIVNIYNPAITILQFDLFCKYFMYFSIGFYMAFNYGKVANLIAQYGWITLLAFILLLFNDLYFYKGIPKQILSILSIPAILFVSIRIKKQKIIEEIGRKTFTIYVWNSIFIFVSMFFIGLWETDIYSNFYFYAPLLITIGIAGPLFLHYIVRKLNLTFITIIVP